MKPVDQTIFGFERGNCVQACVASIFESPLDGVPNFMKDGEENYEYNLKKWCKDIGIICFEIDASGDYEKIFKDSDIIVGGKSPRDETKEHAVVYRNGKLVHDPHPDKTGIVGNPTSVMVFAIKDYSRFR